MTRTLTARWVFPAAGPPLEGGLVTIRGDKIVSVESRGTRAVDEDLGNVAIIPGLVNPHTHLDLSGARGLIPPTDPEHFTDWLRGVIAYRRARTPEQVRADIRAGLAECLGFGTTVIGDVKSKAASYLAVVDAPVRAVLFWELIGLAPERFSSSSAEWGRKAGVDWEADPQEVTYPQTISLRWAASPHAPYSVNHNHAMATLYLTAGPKAIHLAESPGELELLAYRTGPFVS